MTSTSDATIIPITLTVNGRTGLTLWAPPWEDEDGEEWHGFLGDGAKILLYPNARELANFITSGEENDLSDHPAWGRVLKLTPDDLKPAGEDAYDLDEVYEWASGDPDPVHVSALADVVDMVAKIADCCDDGKLRRLVENTPEFEELVDEDVSYQGKEGRKNWAKLGDTIAQTWGRAIDRVESWLSWQGDFDTVELEAESVWDRIGAEPIRIRTAAGTYLTVRADVLTNPDAGDDEDDEFETVFLGTDETVYVFAEVADLARFCREADDHELRRLQWWEELADVEDDEVFDPDPEATYDLRRPTTRGVTLVDELAAFCDLDADTDILDDDPDEMDRDDWRALVSEVETCFTDEG